MVHKIFLSSLTQCNNSVFVWSVQLKIIQKITLLEIPLSMTFTHAVWELAHINESGAFLLKTGHPWSHSNWYRQKKNVLSISVAQFWQGYLRTGGYNETNAQFSAKTTVPSFRICFIPFLSLATFWHHVDRWDKYTQGQFFNTHGCWFRRGSPNFKNMSRPEILSTFKNISTPEKLYTLKNKSRHETL